MSGRRGTVYLVGAGPGSADLITVRGYRLMMGCDALVYDHLVASELVESCPAETKIYVGKVAGRHALPQAQINELLVELASREDGPRRIVRLKGGDPFVFGRGGEEAAACLAAGVTVEVVPGVTAGTAAPASVGVSVTHRDYTRGVIFVTGHARGDGDLELPWKALATSGFSLVFFMSVATIETIAQELTQNGLSGDTPAMVVQEATTAKQRHVKDKLSQIAAAVRKADIRAPAVLVVGKVASEAGRLDARTSVRPSDPIGRSLVV